MSRTIIFSFVLIAISAVAVSSASATSRSPVIGKGSIVSKRVYLGRTASRSKTHQIRIQAIRAKLAK